MLNKKKLFAALLAAALLLVLRAPAALAAEAETAAALAQAEAQVTSSKAIACAIMIALASAGGAIAIALASRKANESIARQPEASGEIRSGLMLSLVFIETAIIYALLVVILVIFVL